MVRKIIGMKKALLLTLVIITCVVAVVWAGCSSMGNVAEVKWIATGYIYKHVTVELVPTNKAQANLVYTVELWEKGSLRTNTGRVSWSQPELNVHTPKFVSFPLTTEEFNAYRYAPGNDLSHIFSAKVYR